MQPKVTLAELDALQEQLREVDGASDMGSLTDQLVAGQIVNVLYPLIEQARMLVQKYDVVVTNPPYMGGSGMNARLSDYVKKYYPDSKSDLFAVFIERCAQMDKRGGYQAMITQHAWMFLSSFEKLRAKLQLIDTVNMAHLGARGFDEIGGEVVQTTSFVMRSSHTKGYKGTYCRLIDGDSEKAKAEMFVSGENRYVAEQDNFSKIPGSPVAYWVSDNALNAFCGKLLSDYAIPRVGCQTSDNNRFLRMWHEIDIAKFKDNANTSVEAKLSKKKWFPYNKGGSYRRWYGNNELLINWENDGLEVKSFATKLYKCSTRTVKNVQFYFREEVTWSTLSSGLFSARYCKPGFLFDTKGSAVFFDDKAMIPYCIAYLNSCVTQNFLQVLSPTLDYSVGAVGRLPYKFDRNYVDFIDEKVEQNISLSQSDWDSFETSWDFKRHPLV